MLLFNLNVSACFLSIQIHLETMKMKTRESERERWKRNPEWAFCVINKCFSLILWALQLGMNTEKNFCLRIEDENGERNLFSTRVFRLTCPTFIHHTPESKQIFTSSNDFPSNIHNGENIAKRIALTTIGILGQPSEAT